MIAGITEKEQKIIEHILDKYRKDYAFFYYGSRVKGTYEKTSDLDVLIKGKAEMPLAILQEIKEEFDKSDLPYIVNFSDYYKLDSSFYERIKPDLIPYNWQEVKLGDVCKFQNGYAFKSSQFTNNGNIKIIKIKEIKEGKIIFFDDSASVFYNDKYKKYQVENDDILVALTGDPVARPNPASWVGRIAIFKGSEKALINQRVAKFLPNKTVLFPLFIYYFFRDFNNFYNLAKKATGSASQANISTDMLENTEILLPPLDVQKKIAGVLGALDDKIELNNKINQNLEAQAQALFKSWFVDFEPFGGQMPDDWKIKTIGDVCASISETYNRKDENVVLINTSDVLNGEILTHTLVKNENLKGQFKKTFQKNDILYSEIRPINKRFAFVDIENTYNYIASTKLMVIRPDTSKISPLILYRILKSQDLIDELQHLAETRSGTFPQITFASELAIQKIVLAPLNEQKRISNVLEVLENKIRKNIQENLRLAELRDALLPKLMSGEISVDDVKIG